MTKQGNYKNKSYNLRITDKLKSKLNFIKSKSGYNNLSDLLVEILNNFVNEYEAEHGEIRIEEEENND